jgi:CTP synthase (UTP-ammonia lyase)
VHIISRLSCSLVGAEQHIRIAKNTLAFKAYKSEKTIEKFQCNYGLNERFRDTLGDGGLQIAGVDAAGAVRVVELPGHRFFLATLYLPQLFSTPAAPHPLILAFIQAAMVFQDEKAQ